MSESDVSDVDPEEMVSTQLALKSQIEKAHSNFRKTPKDRLSWNYIQTKLGLLDDYWKTFQKNHKRILRHIDKKLLHDDIYMNTYFEVEDEYAFARDTFITKLTDFSPPANQFSDQPAQPTTQNVSSAVTIQQIKLPPIQIPSFDGHYGEWVTFHDQFVSLVHLNNSLSNVNKLHLLKQNLSGEAANLLKNIPVTENNYEHAWTKLKKRFSNKRIIVNSYLQKLMSLRNITNESANAIKTLLDTTTDCMSGLEGIGVNTKSWDPIIIYMVTSKLDNESLRHWEEMINRNSDEDLPTYKMLIEYLEMRFRSLEGVQSTKNNLRTTMKTYQEKRVFHSNTPKEGCVVCGDDHYIFKCKRFVQMPIEEKKTLIKHYNLCFNCLIPNHGVKSCKQKSRCRICGKRHHSLIHTERNNTQPPNEDEQEDRTQREYKTSRDNHTDRDGLNNDVATHYATEFKSTPTTNILLATALVRVTAENGRTLQLRALIDQGSEGSFITEAAAQALGLRKHTINGTISGLGNSTVVQAKHAVSFALQSHYDNSLQLSVNAYVLKSLTRLLPSRQVNMTWRHLQGLALADPEYGKPASIDLLLGAEIYCRIMLDGIVSGAPGSPLAQKTRLGWILSGTVDSQHTSSHLVSMHITTNEEDIDLLKRFWEIESETTHRNRQTEEELQCEKIYSETHSRDSQGRYIVEIPFRNKDFDFGDTKQIAKKRLEQLERRLDKDKNLKTEYNKVLMEYIDLEHMEEIDTDNNKMNKTFFMPHHAVIKPDKTTSKLRIVFDASCKGPNGKSLNENMLIGPKLQQDLRHIVMRWRRHEIAIIADCVKMYRQIKVTQESADYQRILWRVNGKLKEYRLTRVTFGTASAPYLATKTLQQLALDEAQTYPKASLIAQTDFYMDDLLSGADNLQEAYNIYTQITRLMQSGGFELQKWASNKHEFINYIEEERAEKKDTYIIKSEEIIKTLGIRWNKVTDTFQYDINLPLLSNTLTKRHILGEISRLFDPMGWLAPVIIKAKIIIQKLWLSGVTWDEQVPTNIKSEWLQFRVDLEAARNINIDRWLHTNDNDLLVELHGYSDASQMAYAAVIFIRIIKADETIHTQLVTAKTRVAPIKTISVPRLELCGAVLLAKLMKEAAEYLNIQQKYLHAYTDSSIVLAWLQSHPTKWKTFVANRTTEILNILPASCWSHVESSKNPADVATRGASPTQLIEHNLWWTGPQELLRKNIIYKRLKENDTQLEMKKENIKVMTNRIEEQNKDFDILTRYSNLTRLYRVTAYILRVFKKEKPRQMHLTGTEINKAREICIKLCQDQEFKEEINRLTNKQNMKKNCRIRSLNPFLDSRGILRVGGRLQNSNLPDHTKHQVILPENHHFTRLILTDYHLKTLHGGPMLLLSNLRQRYWIMRAKSLARQVVHQCVKCARFKANTKNQIMGSLPEVRVTPSKPFLNSGVDFAGPIDLRLSKGRGCKTQKGYLAIFICMVTRAIHIEVVTSLNTTDFIAAFKRFVARRGHCSNMWSDNATNFTAGNKELKLLFEKSQHQLDTEIKNVLANDGTTWHHIPASAPHFGGLWEAGVKSIKYHLRRILGNTTLTYEEMTTVTSQIEACLNSRPISPMSDDPTDLLPLTPGHFLLGDSPAIVPEECYLTSNINSLTRWQLTQRLTQEFWSRWSREYLSRLQQRPKWMTKQNNVRKGDLILLKEDNLPPSKWSLGRVLEVHPGTDKLVRVVTVKCKNSIVKRPIAKVCCLPVN